MRGRMERIINSLLRVMEETRDMSQVVSGKIARVGLLRYLHFYISKTSYLNHNTARIS